MFRIGVPPFLECSTRGDRRFSAFCARLCGRGGRTIETVYQAAKILPDGRTGLDWRAAKSQAAVNRAVVIALYDTLWRDYLAEHPDLVPVLLAATGLADTFGRAGSVCQAEVLWRLTRTPGRPSPLLGG